ncbi:hypothetical protein V8C86DRAFT_2908705 [Haematococcus lacustris]
MLMFVTTTWSSAVSCSKEAGAHSSAPVQPESAANTREWRHNTMHVLCFSCAWCPCQRLSCYASLQGFIPVVMSYAMFFGGAGQLIAGILELIKATAASGWAGFLFNYFAVSKITPSVLAVALTGDTLWCGLWGVLTFLFYIVTLRKNGCLQTIFLTLARCKEAAGYVGFFCGSSAIYAAIAMLYQDELGWTLPGMRPTNFI